MHRSEYAETSSRRGPLGIERRKLEVVHGALGVERGKLEVVRQRLGVENGAHGLGIGPHEIKIGPRGPGIGPPGVERGVHGVENSAPGVERRKLEPVRGKLEVENQALEGERELPGDGGGVRTGGAFRIGAGLQRPADRRRGCVHAAARSLTTANWTAAAEPKAAAVCLFF